MAETETIFPEKNEEMLGLDDIPTSSENNEMKGSKKAVKIEEIKKTDEIKMGEAEIKESTPKREARSAKPQVKVKDKVNPMTQLKLEKLTLNIGTGKDQTKLEKAIMLIKHITGISPVKTITSKRIAAWGLRPGLPIGCKLTLRGELALNLIQKLLQAKENKLKLSWFDYNGNISFGINEYIDIPNVKYDTHLGMMGLQVCITLTKPGYRIKIRKLKKKKISKKHQISKNDAINYMKINFRVAVE